MKHQAVFFLAVGGFVYAAFSSAPHDADADRAGRERPIMVAGPGGGADADEPAADAGEEVVLARGSGGQFHLTAAVEGQDTEFLVDTGADMVALTVDEAERLGLAVDPANFQPMMQTASGTGNGAVVRLASLEVAGATFRDVDAVVMEGLPVNLLGQNVLGRLGAVSLEGDRMVIRR